MRVPPVIPGIDYDLKVMLRFETSRRLTAVFLQGKSKCFVSVITSQFPTPVLNTNTRFRS